MMTIKHENDQNEFRHYNRLYYVEFLEFICRVAIEYYESMHNQGHVSGSMKQAIVKRMQSSNNLDDQ